MVQFCSSVTYLSMISIRQMMSTEEKAHRQVTQLRTLQRERTKQREHNLTHSSLQQRQQRQHHKQSLFFASVTKLLLWLQTGLCKISFTGGYYSDVGWWRSTPICFDRINKSLNEWCSCDTKNNGVCMSVCDIISQFKKGLLDWFFFFKSHKMKRMSSLYTINSIPFGYVSTI